MTISAAQLGAGYAIVPVGEDLNPDHGNVIRRGSGQLMPARAGNYVERSPNTILVDAESGWQFEYPPNSTRKFLIDGRLVPRDGLMGADASLARVVVTGLIVAGLSGAALGAAGGALASRRGKRGKGALIGAGIGLLGIAGAAIGGRIFGKMVTA